MKKSRGKKQKMLGSSEFANCVARPTQIWRQLCVKGETLLLARSTEKTDLCSEG